MKKKKGGGKERERKGEINKFLKRRKGEKWVEKERKRQEKRKERGEREVKEGEGEYKRREPCPSAAPGTTHPMPPLGCDSAGQRLQLCLTFFPLLFCLFGCLWGVFKAAPPAPPPPCSGSASKRGPAARGICAELGAEIPVFHTESPGKLLHGRAGQGRARGAPGRTLRCAGKGSARDFQPRSGDLPAVPRLEPPR